MISLLSSRAPQWAQSLWNSNGQVTNSLTSFIHHFKEIFRQTAFGLSVHNQLFNLHQGNASVSTSALQFCTLAASSSWNETALFTTFQQGLNPEMHQQMVIYDDIIGLKNLIEKAIRISQRLPACSLERPASHPPPTLPSVALPAPIPMQVDSYHLTHADR